MIDTHAITGQAIGTDGHTGGDNDGRPQPRGSAVARFWKQLRCGRTSAWRYVWPTLALVWVAIVLSVMLTGCNLDQVEHDGPFVIGTVPAEPVNGARVSATIEANWGSLRVQATIACAVGLLRPPVCGVVVPGWIDGPGTGDEPARKAGSVEGPAPDT